MRATALRNSVNITGPLPATLLSPPPPRPLTPPLSPSPPLSPADLANGLEDDSMGPVYDQAELTGSSSASGFDRPATDHDGEDGYGQLVRRLV